MRVTPESPVSDRDSYLFSWDTAARRYFNHFEIHKNSARENVKKLLQNFLTRGRDPMQYEHRFREIDAAALRQLLGDISHAEVKELNSVIGCNTWRYYFKSWKEPAAITSFNILPLASLYAAALGIVGYTKIIKGYNNLWLVAGFIPFWTYAFYNYARQPTGEIENCYRYLLAKRAATCELEQNQKKFL